MANLSLDAVGRLKEWLSVPAVDEGRTAYQGEIEQLSPQFGWLVFEDDKWFEYDNDRIVRILQRPGQEWLTDDEGAQLENATLYGTLDSFLPWFKQLVEGWAAGERGIGSAGEAAASQVLGIENPNYAAYPLPGTEFYKYDSVQGYLYADRADASEWRTFEARVDASRVGEAPAAGSVLRGYLYAQSVIAGTKYYAQRPDGSYVYSDREYGDDEHGWQPYEYWQNLQPAARQEIAPDPQEIELLAQNVFSEIERDDPEGGVYSWDDGDRERVRAYISARFKPDMTRAEAEALQEGAVMDLLQALEFEQAPMSEQEVKDFLADLSQEVSALGEVITAIKSKRNLD
jgi:hypothetical protein